MKISLAYNWDPSLPRMCRGLPVFEFYGKLHRDALGGGRSSNLIFRSVTRKEAERQIRELRSLGFEFNYLLNATCFDNLEASRPGAGRIRKLLDWLARIPVDSVTVSLPYVAMMIKRCYPALKVKASSYAFVDSLEKIRYWQDMGVDMITLDPMAVNRRLRFLRRAAEASRVPLQLIANISCLYGCPYAHSHANSLSHGSQEGHSSKGFLINYQMILCRHHKMEDLSTLIKAGWIRPEDVAIYENAGIKHFKIVDRSFPSSVLLGYSKAYSSRRFDGNIVDLFFYNMDAPSFMKFYGMNRLSYFTYVAKYYLRPFQINLFELRKLGKLLVDLPVRIDNRKLDGFLEFFKTNDCAESTCDECGYCRKVADSVIEVDRDRLQMVNAAYREVIDSVFSRSISFYT